MNLLSSLFLSLIILFSPSIKGDNCSSIATLFSLSQSKLSALNPSINCSNLQPGQLVITRHFFLAMKMCLNIYLIRFRFVWRGTKQPPLTSPCVLCPTLYSQLIPVPQLFKISWGEMLTNSTATIQDCTVKICTPLWDLFLLVVR